MNESAPATDAKPTKPVEKPVEKPQGPDLRVVFTKLCAALEKTHRWDRTSPSRAATLATRSFGKTELLAAAVKLLDDSDTARAALVDLGYSWRPAKEDR